MAEYSLYKMQLYSISPLIFLPRFVWYLRLRTAGQHSCVYSLILFLSNTQTTQQHPQDRSPSRDWLQARPHSAGGICWKRVIWAGTADTGMGLNPSEHCVSAHIPALLCPWAMGTPWETASRRFIPQFHCLTGLVTAAWGSSTSLVNANEAAATQHSLALQVEEKWWLCRVQNPLSFLGKIQTHPHDLFTPLWWADPTGKNYTHLCLSLSWPPAAKISLLISHFPEQHFRIIISIQKVLFYAWVLLWGSIAVWYFSRAINFKLLGLRDRVEKISSLFVCLCQ